MGRRVTGWVGEVLLTLGVLVLLFVLWQVWWTDVVSTREASHLVTRLEERFAAGGPGAGSAGAGPSEPTTGGAFALIAVPRFGADWVRPVIEGTGLPVLAQGVGHYDGTAAPGAVGNFAVAGHRTTHGRPFDDIDALRTGDRVVVETREHVYVYEVTGHEVVAPTDVDVIAPTPDRPGVAPTEATMTLTSCHPRYTARQRYVVHARLTETLPPDRAAGLVPSGGG
jgi:sortase A